MSGYPIDRFFHPSLLSKVTIGQLVSGAVGRGWIDPLQTLIGAVKHFGWVVRPQIYGFGQTLVLPYKRSIGAEAILCEAQLFGTTRHTRAQISFGNGWLENATQLDGTNLLSAPFDVRTPRVYRAFKDATAYTEGTLYAITVTQNTVSGVNSGIETVAWMEVPRGWFDPYQTAGDPGLNPASVIPPGRLVESVNTDPTQGTARLYKLLEQARERQWRHIVLATSQERPWTHTASGVESSGTDIFTGCQNFIRTRRIYKNTVEEPFECFVNYASTCNWTLRISVTTSAGTVNRDVGPFLSSGGVGAFTTGVINTSIPTNNTTAGHEQEAEIRYQFMCAGAGTVNLSTVGLIGR